MDIKELLYTWKINALLPLCVAQHEFQEAFCKVGCMCIGIRSYIKLVLEAAGYAFKFKFQAF